MSQAPDRGAATAGDMSDRAGSDRRAAGPRVHRRGATRRAVRRAAAGGLGASVVLASVVLGTGTAQAAPRPVPQPPSAIPSGALVVGDASATCRNPGFTTISDAVGEASAGDTIYVCAGTYEERVDVDMRLRFLGARHGVDGRGGRSDLARESVVTSESGAFRIAGGVDGVVIDGFTLRGSGSAGTNGNGIDAFSRGAGHTFINNLTIEANVIKDRTTGIRVTGAHRSVRIRANNIANSRSTDPASGYGIRLTNETSGLTLTGNVALRSSNKDCQDESSGSRSAGTANNWTLNVGLTSQPRALCLPGLNLPKVPGL